MSKAPKVGIRRFIPSFKSIIITFFIGAILGIGGLAYAVRTVAIPTPSEVSQAQVSIIYYDDGVSEIGRLGEANRESVTIDQIPKSTQYAVLAAEDRDYFKHSGISVKGISRAFFNNALNRSTQGGSTITQQYAKNAYLTQDRTIKRKAKEIILSIKLETVTSKDKILEDYLNTIYFGRGAYGIKTASEQYFGKDVSTLSISESAMLAAIIQAPNGLAPETNLDALKSRWAYVIDGMKLEGWISASDAADASFPKIKKFSAPNVFEGTKGYLLETVRQNLYANGITEDQLNRGGYRITSTFNKDAQTAMEAAVKLEGPKTGTEGLRIGMAAVRPGTGEVLAIYGGADYLKDQLNNATQAIGQAGSTFKPFTLAAAIENKMSLSTEFSGKNHTKVGTYDVVNYSNESWGKKITLLKATEHSVNSAYVECAKEVGLEKVMDSAIRAGIPADGTGMEPNLAFTLGTASPHVIDIAGAYATFAARGMQVKPAYISKVQDSSGSVVYEYKPTPVRAYEEKISDTVSYALQKVVTKGTGKPALKAGRPIAGKTGTTNDNKSALFAGFTPSVAAAVMLTKDDANGNPMTLRGTGGMETVYGASFPARIFTEFMIEYLADSPKETFPPLPKGEPNGAHGTASPSPTTIVSPTAMPTKPAPSESPTTSEPVPTAFVDDLVGLAAQDAIDTLTAAGFTNVSLVEVETNDPSEVGTVLEQSATGDLPVDTPITLTVGIAPTP